MTASADPAPRGAVVVIEPMSSGTGLLSVAREAGLAVVAVSRDDGDRRLADDVRGSADVVLEVETNDDRSLDEAVLGLSRRQQLVAVLPGFEFYVPAAARLSHRLGLPGHGAQTVLACRDKFVMRETVRRAGLRVPRYAFACAESELDWAARTVGLPCVLKPIRSAGSVHVNRADTLPDLHDAYRWLVADTRRDLGHRLDGRVLVEEYVAGPEVSVEGFVANGQVRVVAVTQKHLGPEPFFVEIGHIVQADLPSDVRAAVEQYAVEVVRALGISLGPFHCELRLPGGVPVLIELGARLPGDHIVELVEMATGVSLPRVMLAAHRGQGPEAAGAFGAPTAKYAGIRFFIAPELPVYAQARGLDDMAHLPGVVDVRMDVEPGEPIPPAEDFRCRLGHALFVADSHAEALERFSALEQAVHLV